MSGGTREKTGMTTERAKMVPVNKCVTNSIQNPIRGCDMALEALLGSIREHGVKSPGHVIENGDGTYTIADGHRRHACCVKLGIGLMPAFVHPRGTETWRLFVELNKTARPMKGSDWLRAWASVPRAERAQFLRTIPVKTAGDIKEFCRVLGVARAEQLADGRQSPSLARMTSVVNAAYAARMGERLDERELTEWLAKYGTGVQMYFRGSPNKKGCARFRSRMASGAPFPRSDWL